MQGDGRGREVVVLVPVISADLEQEGLGRGGLGRAQRDHGLATRGQAAVAKRAVVLAQRHRGVAELSGAARLGRGVLHLDGASLHELGVVGRAGYQDQVARSRALGEIQGVIGRLGCVQLDREGGGRAIGGHLQPAKGKGSVVHAGFSGRLGVKADQYLGHARGRVELYGRGHHPAPGQQAAGSGLDRGGDRVERLVAHQLRAHHGRAPVHALDGDLPGRKQAAGQEQAGLCLAPDRLSGQQLARGRVKGAALAAQRLRVLDTRDQNAERRLGEHRREDGRHGLGRDLAGADIARAVALVHARGAKGAGCGSTAVERYQLAPAIGLPGGVLERAVGQQPEQLAVRHRAVDMTARVHRVERHERSFLDALTRVGRQKLECAQLTAAHSPEPRAVDQQPVGLGRRGVEESLHHREAVARGAKRIDAAAVGQGVDAVGGHAHVLDGLGQDLAGYRYKVAAGVVIAVEQLPVAGEQRMAAAAQKLAQKRPAHRGAERAVLKRPEHQGLIPGPVLQGGQAGAGPVQVRERVLLAGEDHAVLVAQLIAAVALVDREQQRLSARAEPRCHHHLARIAAQRRGEDGGGGVGEIGLLL